MTGQSDGPLQPGQDLLARYRLQDRLGEGDQGMVYRAEEIEGGRSVVVKFLKELAAPDRVGTVADGLSALIGLQDEHLIPLLYVSREGVPGLVYEHQDGASLARLLEKHERLAPAAALRVARGVATGLASLHQAGRGHGVLHPKNILLDRQGKARVADLGWEDLATLAVAEPPPTPPAEEWQRRDVQQLGRLIFHMLVGGAFEGGSSDLAAHLADVPQGLRNLVAEALDGKLPDVASFRARLDEQVQDKSVGSRKTAYDVLSERIVESGARPPPDLSGPDPEGSERTRSAEEGRRRRSEVLKAVGSSGKTQRAPPKLPGLAVEMGKREGPTMASVFLIVLLGAGLIGGLGYLANEATKQKPAPPPVLGGAGGGRPSDAPHSVLPQAELDPENLSELTRAIIDESRAARRVELVQMLLRLHAAKAPETLAKVIRGGNIQLRRHLLPFLESLDASGAHRLELMRFALGDSGPWPIFLGVSLARTGHQRDMAMSFGERQGPGADVAMAASSRGSQTLAPGLAARLEGSFFAPEMRRQDEVLAQWIEAGGGGEGPVARWVADTLLVRVRDEFERKAVIETLGRLEPTPALFDSLYTAMRDHGRGWDSLSQQNGPELLKMHAGQVPGREEKIAEATRVLQGY